VRRSHPGGGDDQAMLYLAWVAVFVGLLIAAVIGWRMILRGR
jgi:hypothetical protein